MKKIFLLILCLILFFVPAFADEWDSMLETNQSWDGQKSITNKEFEEAINVIEGKKKKKEEKKKRKKIKKISGGGTSLHSELNPNGEIVKQDALKQRNEEDLIINIPVKLQMYDGEILDKGFYKVTAKKEKNELYLLFYQSQFYMGRVKAKETLNDYEQETLDFVNLIPYNEDYVKIIFGSMDLNAYSFVKISNDL